MRYFGEKWNAPALEDAEPIETPVGSGCMFCDDAIEAGDQGIVTGGGASAHIECWVRQAIGGANHILGRCSCGGGDQPPDPPDLSRREAAKLAVRLFEQSQRAVVN